MFWSLKTGASCQGQKTGQSRRWDIPSKSCLATLDHPSGVLYLAGVLASLSSRRIVSGSHDGTLRIWDATTYSCLYMHSTETLQYLLSDGRVLCAHENSLSLWSLDSSEQKYLSSTFSGKAIDFNHSVVSSCIQQQGNGRPFSSERVLIHMQ